LILEITESMPLENLALVRPLAERLKELGIRLALDDFGTGFSSLYYLQALPIDELKIDRSFVRSMTTEHKTRKIVAAMIGLSRSLRLATVAEGVESHSQVEALLALGCETGQGYLVSPAIPQSQVKSLLRIKLLLRPQLCISIPS
jgi:EAL domain-containing protein (putative c-di-GMP-specific phosphodiesterase class I)